MITSSWLVIQLKPVRWVEARRLTQSRPKGWLVLGLIVLWVLFVLFGAVLVLGIRRMKPTAEVLRRDGGPGIVAFEMARTNERARQIFSTWGPAGKTAARSNTHWDFAFVVGYGGVLATAWLLCRGPLRDDVWSWLGPASLAFAAAAAVAALCDAAEDIALLAMLRRPEASDVNVLAHAAFGFALVKWVVALIVAACLLPALAGAFVALLG
jgi:hypothetical protein